MNLKKPLLIAGIASSVAFASLAAASGALAETSGTPGPDNLIQKIAQKFNLKEADVKAVFEEDRAAHEAEHQKKIEDKLSQAVTNGKLTNEQKDKIIAKQKEFHAKMESNREDMKDKTEDEHRKTMEAERAELEQWAKDNNIPIEYLHPGKVMVRFGGPGPRVERRN
jgi:hypothetical protein